VRVGRFFGAFAIAFALDAVLAALTSGEWRFVPAAVIGGLLVDALVWIAPVRRRPLVAATAFPAILALTIGASLAVTGDLGWTPTLLLGTAVAGSVFGAGLALLTRYLGNAAPELAR